MTTLFTRYARATVLFVLLIAAAGFGSLHTLGRQEDPSLIERYALVVTAFPGASAERVEALVTEPLEESVMELAELDRVRSVSRAGVSVLDLTLRGDLDETEVDQAWTLVREQVDKAAASFPSGVGAPDIQRQYIGAATMIVALSWADGSEEGLGVLNRLASDLQQRFQAMPGTEETQIFGAANEEIRVLADADKLAALGVSVADMAVALAASDAKAPAGQVRADGVNLGVEVAGEFDGRARVADAPLVQRPGGETVRIGDVARVEKGVESPPSAVGLIDGRRAIFVAAYLQPELRVDRWTVRANDLVAAFAEEAPSAVDVAIAFEQSEYVDRRLNGLAGNLMMSALIVFAVLFFMMGWRAAFIVGTALPLTTLLVLILIGLYGETLHQMSVTGLVISLGLLIDNAIVMVDEYRLKRAKGATRLEAVDGSVRHLFAPLAASTVTTMLAFAPIALMPDVTGEFISMIGVSVIFAVGSSFLLAMTVVPAFAAWFDREPEPGRRRWFWQDGISWAPLTRVHRWSVRQVARAPAVGVLIGLVLPGAGIVAATQLPQQFFPPTDRDMFQIEMVLPPSASIAETRRETERAVAAISAYEGVESIAWVIGEQTPRTYYNVLGGGSGQPSFAAGWVRTTSKEATRAIIVDLQRRVREEFPAARFLALPFEQGPPVQAPVELLIFGPEFATLDRLGDEARRHLAEAANVTYTTAGLQLGAPVATIEADEAKTRLAGRRLDELAGLVRADLDGVEGGSVLEGVEELPVRVILDDAARRTLASVRGKALPGAPGAAGLGTPVSALGDVALEPQVAVIRREQGERVNPIHGHIEPFSLPDIANRDFHRRLEEAGFADQLPSGYHVKIGGVAETSGDAVGGLFATAVPLLILMIGALVLAFNSFGYAGVVGLVGLQSVGLAMFGVWLFGQPMGFNAIVGAMGLIGLAINGSIVVLSALRAAPAAASGDAAAVADVTVEATRHIIATTLTTIGGFTPLLLAGDSFWMPLAAAIAGGVAGSAVLALYFAPAMFAFMARRRSAKEARRARRASGAALAQPAE
ncbi:MAG: efflux RND transporter permease subunit [Caulobacterales bacterium]|nr:efflux RND transporter permease subunit [Caulobacterales bacterium]